MMIGTRLDILEKENTERKKENAYLTEQVENLWTTIRKLEARVYSADEISELKDRLDKKDEQIATLTRICTSLSQNQVLY